MRAILRPVGGVALSQGTSVDSKLERVETPSEPPRGDTPAPRTTPKDGRSGDEAAEGISGMLVAALEAIHAGHHEEARTLCLRALATDPSAPGPHGLAALLERNAGTDPSRTPRTRSAARVAVRTLEDSRPKQRRASLEALIAALVKNISECPASELDHEIGHALSELGVFTNVDRTYIIVADPHGRTISNTHEWVAAGITSEIEVLQALPLEAFAWTFEQLSHFGLIDYADIDTLPDEAATERSALKAQGIRSILLVPIPNTRLPGFIGFDAVRNVRPWEDDDITLLKMAAAVLGVALERKRTERTLTERESRIFAVMAALPDAVLGLDIDGRVLVIKEHPELELSPDNSTVETLEDLLPQDLAESFKAAAAQTADDGRLRSLRYCRTLDHKNQHFEARFARQDTQSVVVVIRNITPHIEATLLLEEHRGLLQRLAAKQLIVEEEQRAETARLIHDGIGQDIAMSGLLLKQARSELGLAAPRSMLDGLRVIDGAITKVRELSLSLSPPALLELGLVAALEMTGRDLAGRHGLEFEFEEVTTTARLPRPMEILLYRVVRELMINVIKHAEASQFSVFIECHEELVTASVEDDGRGIDVGNAERREGFGLLSIREQLTPLSGSLVLQPLSAGGTVATISIPHPFAHRGVAP
jgi:signal transduction histidine kinase